MSGPRVIAAASALLALAAVAATASDAPPPSLVNARLETRSAAEGLQATVRRIVEGTPAPAWIGYAVPVDGAHSMCCWESVDSIERTACPGCLLEGKGAFSVGSAAGPVNLEADRTFLVLLRTEGRRLGRVRSSPGAAGSTPEACRCTGLPASSHGKA